MDRLITLFMCAVLCIALGVGLGMPQDACAATVDNSIYAELLYDYVDDKGLVDYDGLKKDEAKLDAYLEILSSTKRSELSRDELYAFYINVYNAFTLKLILMHYPVDSIRDIGNIIRGPWKQEIVILEGDKYHLDNIEHDILRPDFQDARVHFAVNCSAMSCPPLLGEPFTGAKLQQQLDDVTYAFINDPKWTWVDGDELHVTRIMKWFNEDFQPDEVAFVKQYAKGELKAKLEALGDKVDVEYQDYDWALNIQK